MQCGAVSGPGQFFQGREEVCPLLPAVPNLQLSASWQSYRTSLALLRHLPHWGPPKNLPIFWTRTVRPAETDIFSLPSFDLLKKARAVRVSLLMDRMEGWDGDINIYSHAGWAPGTVVTSVQLSPVPLRSCLQGTFSRMAWYMSSFLQGSSLMRLWLHDQIPRRKIKLLCAL